MRPSTKGPVKPARRRSTAPTSPPTRPSAAASRSVALQAALDDVLRRCDVAARVATDPVEFVRRYPDRLDAELVGLIASSVAFGNVKALRAKLADALERLGASPALVADDAEEVQRRLRGWKHRVWIADDLARMIVGARAVQRAWGSLGERFAHDLAEHPELRDALAAFVGAIREGHLDRVTRRSARHLLPDPHGASGCKRLLLFLRWMVRADGADLGLWKDEVSAARLLIPVDVHIHKLSRNLGLTRRAAPSWNAAEDITEALRRFSPDDPVRYDFALCHMGMAQRCPSRRDEARCDGCAVKPVCRHWVSGRRRTA